MKIILSVAAAFFLALCSCSKMDASYKQYLSNGEIIYVGTPYNLIAHPGRGRVQLEFTQSKDPNIVKYVIYWNNRGAQQEVKADTTPVQKVVIPNLPEGNYTFELVAFDKAGNTSTPGSAVISGSSLGTDYESSLAVRLSSFTNSSAGLILKFVSADSTCQYTTMSYTNTGGNAGSITENRNAPVSDTIRDAAPATNSITLKTAYIPPSGIDTFYASKVIPVNLLAADYTCTGTMADNVNASLTGPYPWNITLRATSLTQLELVDDDYTKDVYHKILNGGSNSYYGSFGVVINIDNNYNVVSVVNKYGQPSSNGRSAELDPSGVNKFDPVARVLKVKYWMDQPGATHRTSFDETFTMK